MIFDSNCLEIILFHGHKGRLVQKMAETCKCEESLATEFINEYFTFLTKEEKAKIPQEVRPDTE